MELQEASQLGTVDDVLSLIDVFGSVMHTLLPFFGGCLIIYVGYRIYKRHEKKKEIAKQQRQVNKEIKKQQKELNKQTSVNSQIFNNENEMMRKLNNTESQYYDNRFDSLALEFDENGRAK